MQTCKINTNYFGGLKNKPYLCTAFKKKAESLAQQVEHIPFKDGVLGSSPKRFTKH